MSNDLSRKRFLAKMFGLAAAGAVAPAVFAKAVSTNTVIPAKAAAAIKVSPQSRAVARTDLLA